LLYTYNPLTDKELKKYIKFLDSKTGQGMNNAVIATMKGLFDKTGKAIGKGLSKSFAKKAGGK